VRPQAQRHTLCSRSTELDAVVHDLRERGVTFEEYDMPGLKTVDGIADRGGMKTAWFKDSEGNIIAVSERG
jgi:hypothetical protein